MPDTTPTAPTAAVSARAWLRRSRGARADETPAEFAWRALWMSRAVIWVGGVAALASFGKVSRATMLDPLRLTEPFHNATANLLIAPAARWDSVWYLAIAQRAYFSRQSSAFFPLYPLLIRGGSAIVGSPTLVATLIALLAAIGAVFALHRLTELDLGASVARTTVLLVAFFPTSFFLSAAYPESLYLLLSLAALYAARMDRWAVAGVVGALASAARPNGALIALPLAWMYLYGPRANAPRAARARRWLPRYRVSPSLAWLALVPVGLVAYLAYLGVAHGDAFAPFGAQVYWNRHFTAPFGAVPAAIAKGLTGAYRMVAGHPVPLAPGEAVSADAHNLLNLGFLAFAVVGLAAAWRRVPSAYVAYAVAMLAQSLAYPAPQEPLMAFGRYLVVIFPLFMGAAAWLDGRVRLNRGVVLASALSLGILSAYWTVWGWIA